jgi:hypothetical protein
MPAKPTTEQLHAVTHAICKVIAQIPCFHLFEAYVAHRFSSTETEIALRAITYNAALDSTLMSLRSFNEFFTSDRRKDDIRASDFLGVSMQTFLAPDDATAINKYLAHITTPRADIVTKHWFIDDMVLLGLQHGIEFLSTIETTFPPSTEAALAELRGVRDVVRRLIPNIKKRNAPSVA